MNKENKLLSEVDLSEILLPIMSTSEMETNEITVPIKVVSPLIDFEWYLYEYDKDNRICWGFVKGYFNEIGSVSLDELISIFAEIDCTYVPVKLNELTGW